MENVIIKVTVIYHLKSNIIFYGLDNSLHTCTNSKTGAKIVLYMLLQLYSITSDSHWN